jgi:CheY-like chemotaxis protein
MSARQRQLELLVVDDDPDMRRYIQRGLERGIEGGHVHQAADGEEALRMIAAEHFDVVITDVLLPRLDGLSLCRALDDDPEMASLPVLIVSGELDAVERAQDLVRGHASRSFLPKPFNSATLCAAVERLLGANPER